VYSAQPIKVLAQKKLIYQVITGDLQNHENTLTSLFASIPYNNYDNNIILDDKGYHAFLACFYIRPPG
jgi:hypothetical protein